MTHALFLLIHLLAVTAWVGGMLVMHSVVRPTAIEMLEPPLRLPFMSRALGRFFRVVDLAIAATFFSGAGLIFGLGGLPRYASFMVLVATLMVAIYLRIRAGLYRRLRAAVEAQDWPAAAVHLASIRVRVAINLVLGVSIYVVTLLGRSAG